MSLELDVLLILVVLLAVMTIVGHGIWVLLAALFGGRSTPALPVVCPRCRSRLLNERCPVCNWPAVSMPRTQTLESFAAVLEQIQRYSALGLMDKAACERLVESLEAERQRLATPASANAIQTAELVEPRPADAVDIIAPPPERSADEVSGLARPVDVPIGVPAKHPLDADSELRLAPDPRPLPIEDRARQFAERRTAAFSHAARLEEPSTVAPSPRRPVFDLLSAFLEEQNIRWGELIGGLLIVGCSIALVISFWAKIAERPFLKFFVFNGVTAALFGLGLYAAHRWKLRTTSRAVLLISILLVPLNFLAIAAFTEGSTSLLTFSTAGEAISVLLFAALCTAAARIVTPRSVWLLVVGVLAPSLAQLLVRRWVHPAADAEASEPRVSLLLALGAVPTVVYAVVNIFGIWRQRVWGAMPTALRAHDDAATTEEAAQRQSSTGTFFGTTVGGSFGRNGAENEPDTDRAGETLALLGATTFAALLPLGLLLFKTGHVAMAVHQLAILVSALGLTPLAVGLFLWQRLTDKSQTTLRTTGLSIAVAGMMLLLGGVVLAWPDPATLLPTSLLVAVVLSTVAAGFGLAEVHFGAAACLTLAYLTAWHLAAGRLIWHGQDAERAARAFISGSSGQSLVPLAAFYFATAALLVRWLKLPRDARAVAIAAAGVAAISIGLIGWFGFAVPGDPLHVTWIFALYGIATCVAAARLAQQPVLPNRGLWRWMLWIGAGLTLGACVQGVVYLAHYRWPLALPWATAFALEATVMAGAAAACRVWPTRSELRRAGCGFGQAALAASIVAFALVTAGSGGWPHSVAAGPLAIHWLWLAIVWLGLALLDLWPPQLFAAFQLALAVAAWFGVAVSLETREWFLAAHWRWLDPWTLQAEGVGLAVFCLAWTALRRLLRERHWAALLNSSWRTETVVLPLVLTTLVGLSCYAAWPGVAQELSPRAIATVAHAPPVAPALASFELFQIPHDHAGGWGAWLLLTAVVIALAAEAVVFRKRNRIASILLAFAMACPLAASWWESQLAVASATRWYAAFYLIAATGLMLGWQARRSARRLVGGTMEHSGANKAMAAAVDERALLFFLGGAPALAAASYAVVMALGRRPMTGPDPLSLFGRMGTSVSYSGPVALVALVLVAFAIRERSDLFALAGGLVANLAATIAYLLRLADAGLPLHTAAWIGLAQLNAIAASIYVLAWIGCRSWDVRRRGVSAANVPEPMLVQLGLAAACNLAVLAPAWWTLVESPSPGNPLPPVAGAWGWSAAVLTIAAIFAAGRLDFRWLGRGVLTVLLWCLATLVAWTACRWDSGNWLGFHVLLVAHAAAAWLIAGIGQFVPPAAAKDDQGGQSCLRIAASSSLASLAVAVCLALRALTGDPQAPWWTIGVLASQALLAAWLAWCSFRPGLLYVAMPLINLAASIWWWHDNRLSVSRGGLSDFIAVNIVALALPGVAWLMLELLRFRPHKKAIAEGPIYAGQLVPPHRTAARVSLAALAFTVGVKLVFCAAVSRWLGAATVPEWLALGATAAIWVALLWDGEARDAVAGLYFVGLVAAGVLLDQIQPEPKWLWWTGDIVLAAYALATSFLWSRRAGLRSLADRLHVPRIVENGSDPPLAGLPWLAPVNCTVVAIVVALSFGFVLTYDDFAFRLVAAKAVLAQMVTLGFLARGERRWRLQYASLTLGVLGATAIGWAGLQPAAGTLLNRVVVVAGALAISAAVYGLGLTKLLAAGNDWLRAARRLVPVLVAFDICAVVFVLVVETSQVANRGHVSMDPGAIAAMTAVLAGLCAAALAAAVLPGRDPLSLSERGRQAYVYAAESMLVLAFVHLRLCEPQWFHGILQEYWPLVVQGIAFVGVGIGEWFRRRRWSVVGEPLANTGALLPLLPVLGFWIVPARVDYSLLLLAIGLLYGALSVMRRSFGFGLLAVLAANGSLWYFLAGHEGYRLLEHPQLWMIPPALCVLAAAHLNRRQLTAAQLTSIRYGASIVIYVSSTADIFLQGVARAPWLPLVLAGFSLAGVLLGIVLRVRAFLILGTSFLLLSLLTIIWYAAVDLQQTWLWYAAGIVVGVLILVVFAIFEKQRQAVTNLLDQLKKWQP